MNRKSKINNKKSKDMNNNKNNNNFMSYLGIKEKMQKQINKTNNENFILWCWDSGANNHVVPVSVELDNETMVNQMLNTAGTQRLRITWDCVPCIKIKQSFFYRKLHLYYSLQQTCIHYHLEHHAFVLCIFSNKILLEQEGYDH